MEQNLIIKRTKYNTYHEEDILCNGAGQRLTAPQSNLNKRNRWGSKQYNYNGQKINVIRWEFYNQNGEFIKAKNL
jgi:hypothetical protein